MLPTTREPEFRLVTTCMGRLEHLRQSLGAAAAQPSSTCVVVDYSCPEHCGEWVRGAFPDVQVVSVPGRTRFCLTEARNAGARNAVEPWLVFLDADVILAPNFLETLRPLLRPGRFFRAQPLVNHLSGTVVCRRDDFVRVDGYDEAIRGYGGEDVDFYSRLERVGVKEDSFPAALLTPIPHGDDLRVQHYEIKNRGATDLANQLYTQAKLDVTAALGAPLSLSDREVLYRRVYDWVRHFFTKPQMQRRLEVRFRRATLPRIGLLDSYVLYVLTPEAAAAAVAAQPPS